MLTFKNKGSIAVITTIVTIFGASVGLLLISLHKFKKIKLPFL